MGYYIDGVLQEGDAPEFQMPEAPVHPLDDGRVLEGIDAWARCAHFDKLENLHLYTREYPSIEEQLDMLYWDKVNDTENWKEMIDTVKAGAPKTDTSDMSIVRDEFGN